MTGRARDHLSTHKFNDLCLITFYITLIITIALLHTKYYVLHAHIIVRVLHVFNYLENFAAVGGTRLVHARLVHTQCDAVEEDDGHADSLEPRVQRNGSAGQGEKYRSFRCHLFYLWLLSVQSESNGS